MKLTYVASAAALAFGTMLAPAAANEVQEACEEFSETYETGYTGCACLGEKAEADADLKEAILAIETPEDLEAADESVTQAVADCAE